MTSGNSQNPIARLQRLWQYLHTKPGGTWLFSKILAWAIPYTGTIGAKINILNPGYAKIELRERRRVRNHLNSVHAVALVNLGELASGLAMLGTLPADVRGIPTRLSIDYFKKARGVLLAESHCTPPTVIDDTDFEVTADIHDAQGDLVARTYVNWRLGPVPKS